jgi:hypothetical protein
LPKSLQKWLDRSHCLSAPLALDQQEPKNVMNQLTRAFITSCSSMFKAGSDVELSSKKYSFETKVDDEGLRGKRKSSKKRRCPLPSITVNWDNEV